MHPRARRKGLLVKKFPHQTFVYDLARDKVHTLGCVAATVWAAADGRTSIEELARRVQQECEASADLDAVKLVIERLARVQLIEGWPPPRGASVPLSRRVALRRIAEALAVTTFVAPGATWAGITS